MPKIADIEGIGLVQAEKLRKTGLRSTTALLKRGGMQKVARNWHLLRTLPRVDTVPELEQRNAKALYETLVKTNEAKKLVRKLPAADQVAEWIKQARTLPRVLAY